MSASINFNLDDDYKNISLSHATMRDCDLFGAFLGFIATLDKGRGVDGFFANERNIWLWYSQGCDDGYNYERGGQSESLTTAERETMEWILYGDVCQYLDEIAPENCGFSSHPGDGSDYGFWEFEPDFEYV